MIRLVDILLEVDITETKKRSIWRTYANRFGARNTLNQVRYFKSREKATQFARGEISGPKVGKPIKAKQKMRVQPIQTYDYTPV